MLSNPNIGIVILLFVLAFFLFPAYEHFKDAQGREVDVDPNAPPKPEWLKSRDPRTGEIESFVSSNTSNPVPSNVKLIPPVSVPPTNLSSTLGATPGGTTDTLTAKTSVPSNNTQMPFDKPKNMNMNGVTPSETADTLSSSVPSPASRPSNNLTFMSASATPTHLTRPPVVSDVSAFDSSGMGSDYIKKSSLVPCIRTTNMGSASRTSVIPGDQDMNFAPSTNSIEALSRAKNQFNIMKPTGASFTNDDGGVQGFLNSFNAFAR
jgi:hypothetical protein